MDEQDSSDFSKTTCVEILSWIRDLYASGQQRPLSAFDIGEFLAGVEYEDDKHRLNDASQRLRKLERSGYLEKVKAPVEKESEIPGEEGDGKPKRPRGRPPSFYALTEKGQRYANTIANLYLNHEGKPVDKEMVIPVMASSTLAIDQSGMRIIVATPTREGTIHAVEKWMKESGKAMNLIHFSPVIQAQVK